MAKNNKDLNDVQIPSKHGGNGRKEIIEEILLLMQALVSINGESYSEEELQNWRTEKWSLLKNSDLLIAHIVFSDELKKWCVDVQEELGIIAEKDTF